MTSANCRHYHNSTSVFHCVSRWDKTKRYPVDEEHTFLTHVGHFVTNLLVKHVFEMIDRSFDAFTN